MALAAHITQPTVATTTTTHTHTGVRLLADTRNEQCKFRQILRIFGLIKSSIENIRLKCLLHPLHSMHMTVLLTIHNCHYHTPASGRVQCSKYSCQMSSFVENK